MSRHRIDPDKVRALIRKLPRGDLLQIVESAIHLLPASQLVRLVRGYARAADLRLERLPDRPLLEIVKEFHDASVCGAYYDSFDVNSKNFTEISEGTQAWIAECNRLLDRSLELCDNGGHAESRECFDLIFALLLRIDDGRDDILFFADEGGTWQFGIDWHEVLVGYFRCLGSTAEPAEFAGLVIKTIDGLVSHDRDRHLRDARYCATRAQRKALDDLA